MLLEVLVTAGDPRSVGPREEYWLSQSLLSGFVLEKNKFVKKKNQDVPYSRYLIADSILHIWDIVWVSFCRCIVIYLYFFRVNQV